MSFAGEKNNIIKKELLFTLPNICEVISLEYIYSKIFDILRRLSNDLSPKIRKICINVIAKIIIILKNKTAQENKNAKGDNDERAL